MDYRELKEELGLDHFEGRHWLGWHHHVTLVTLAYAFLRFEQARLKQNSGCDLAASAEEAATDSDKARRPLSLVQHAISGAEQFLIHLT